MSFKRLTQTKYLSTTRKRAFIPQPKSSIVELLPEENIAVLNQMLIILAIHMILALGTHPSHTIYTLGMSMYLEAHTPKHQNYINKSIDTKALIKLYQ